MHRQTDPSIGARLARIWRHCKVNEPALSRRFDAAAFERIEAAIAAGESSHRGEIRFALEARLDAAAIWRGQSARERALEVFASYGVWDTEANTGVLIYLLWADHAVEIVADRGASPALADDAWRRLCAGLAAACRDECAVDGVIETIGAINAALAQSLPHSDPGEVDELPNKPIRL